MVVVDLASLANHTADPIAVSAKFYCLRSTLVRGCKIFMKGFERVTLSSQRYDVVWCLDRARWWTLVHGPSLYKIGLQIKPSRF